MDIKKTIIFTLFSGLLILGSCSKTESYSNLLRDENRAVNWYLAGQKVEVEIPEDGNFKVGKEAPYYKMNDDGTIYMQIIIKGDMNESSHPKEGEKVFFRFSRKNIKLMMNGQDPSWEGNSNDLSNAFGPTSFIYGNKYLESTTQFGSGIQLPLEYVGYNSEVNIILKATSGFTEDQATCVPYIYNVRYFKAEY